MVGKKKIFKTALGIMLSVSLLAGCSAPAASGGASENKKSAQGKNEVFKIGIAQIVEHPALDASREGFIDALKEGGFKNGENIDIEFQSAQGDPATAQTIAASFVADKKDMILAIATPTAQAAFNTTKEIPVLITAVTDPIEAGLVKSWEKTETNVTGTSDMAPIEEQFKLLKELIPSSKKVGILFNTSEVNSEIQLKMAEKIAPKFNLQIEKAGVTNVNEIPQAMQSLLDKVDVIYVLTDNMVASAMPLIVNESMKKNIPIIGSEKGHVEAGALATEGIDYYKLGFQTGLMAIEVINGKAPENMSIDTLKDTQLIINQNTADILKINISEELKKSAELIKGGE